MGTVTVEIPAWFIAQMRRLLGLKFAPASMDTHWEALQHVEEPVIDAALTEGVREWGEFPSPQQILGVAERIRGRVIRIPDEDPSRETVLEQPIAYQVPHVATPLPVTREWRYYCEDCSDCGWRSVWCGPLTDAKPWQESGHCGKRGEHPPHEFVVMCPCASSNPDIRRKQERARQAGRRGGDQ